MCTHLGSLATAHLALGASTVGTGRTRMLKEVWCDFYTQFIHLFSQFTDLPLGTIATTMLEEVV